MDKDFQFHIEEELSTDESTTSEVHDTEDADFGEGRDKDYHFPNQQELNDLIRDLGLTTAMMGDYVWSIVRRDKTGHKRKSRSNE